MVSCKLLVAVFLCFRSLCVWSDEWSLLLERCLTSTVDSLQDTSLSTDALFCRLKLTWASLQMLITCKMWLICVPSNGYASDYQHFMLSHASFLQCQQGLQFLHFFIRINFWLWQFGGLHIFSVVHFWLISSFLLYDLLNDILFVLWQ